MQSKIEVIILCDDALISEALDLILHLITEEVSRSAETNTLFRANSNATKCFKTYVKLVGLPYLFRTLAVLFEGIV